MKPRASAFRHTVASMRSETLVIFFDVDDTLVRSVGAKRIPMPRVIDRVRTLHAAGATLYCWSSGGSAYARQSAAELGLAECFVAFLPKPHVIVDDQAPAEWKYSRLVRLARCRVHLGRRGVTAVHLVAPDLSFRCLDGVLRLCVSHSPHS